jgi:hypothetical protein
MIKYPSLLLLLLVQVSVSASVLVTSSYTVDGSLQDGASTSAVVLDSPLDYQVFQRETPNEGKILVRGRALAPCDRDGRLFRWAVVAYRG